VNNDEVILKGKGHQHHKNGFFGDLIVKIRILGYEWQEESTKFKKVGFNTYETLKVSVISAVLGARCQYNTVWGERTLTLRGGIQDGDVIKRSN
jgi:DnaJ-class molecular chaperone